MLSHNGSRMTSNSGERAIGLVFAVGRGERAGILWALWFAQSLKHLTAPPLTNAPCGPPPVRSGPRPRHGGFCLSPNVAGREGGGGAPEGGVRCAAACGGLPYRSDLQRPEGFRPLVSALRPTRSEAP